MKNTLPFLLLIILALGCNKFGPGSSSTSNTNLSNANSNAAPAKIVKVVDLPATIGKTKEEIKAMIPGTPKSEDPWLEYSLESGDLTFMFNKQKKASDSSFRFKSISVGDASISGTDTAEQIGTMTGIDIKGKTPTSTSSLADTYEQEIGGKKLECVFYHSLGKFDTVMIHDR
jgi:hypothetical protein